MSTRKPRRKPNRQRLKFPLCRLPGRRRSVFELLEVRHLMTGDHTFAQFADDITTPGVRVEIPIALNTADFTFRGDATLLGFHVRRTAGLLDSAAVDIRGQAGDLLTPVYSNADVLGGVDSVALFEVGSGQVTVLVGGENGALGSFALDVFLVGDADGNRSVDRADADVIRNIFGAQQGEANYVLEADANLDGRITSFDLFQWQLNSSDATDLQPLDLAVQLEVGGAATLGLAATVGDDQQVVIRGTTSPVATVELDTDGDGDADMTKAPAADGSFSFDLSFAELGPRMLSLTASDRFGQKDVVAISLSIVESFQITDVSPADGDELVSVTREAIVRFSEEVNRATINVNSFQVIANGQVVSGRRVVSSTNRFVTFFPDQPWPASTQIRLQLDGNQILSADGDALDANRDGVAGGIMLAAFRTLPLTRIPGANFSARVVDAFNKNLDGSDIPIVGATIRVDGFPEANAVTDANGEFTLVDMPAPVFFVHIDGTTAINAPPGTIYPSVGKPFQSVPGQTVVMPMNIHLPPVSIGDIAPLPVGQTTDVGFGPGGKVQLQQMFPAIDPAMWDLVKVTFAPNSALDDAGNVATQAVVIPVPPDRLPSPLPVGQDPKLVISIQPLGATNFDVPAPVSLPNVEGLQPGQKSLLWSFSHDAGRWEAVGVGTVSADGMTIDSDPGMGFLAPGWHFTNSGSQGSGLADNVPDVPFNPCESPSHKRLVEENLSDVVDQALNDTGSEVQSIADGSGDFVYDEYTVTIDLMPPGTIPEDYLRELANDIEAAVDDAGFNFINRFERHGDTDAAVGDIYDIDIFGPDDGSVMITEIGPNYFDVITIETPSTGGHPEFGSREFGFERNPDGSVSWYTRGASRPRGVAEGLVGGPIQSSGWKQLMDGIRDELVERGGAERPDSITQKVKRSATPPDCGPASMNLAPTPAISQQLLLQADEAPREYLYRVDFTDLANFDDTTRTITGKTNELGGFSEILPNGVTYGITLYNPATREYGIVNGQASGDTVTDFGLVRVFLPDAIDNDTDGLGEVAEFILGTFSDAADSDGDGVLDGAEVEQGLNPLDGRAYPTGVIASLAMPGRAEGVDPVGDLIYVATGSHGLAIVDGSTFDNPIQLGQLDLPGTATDVGVDPALNIAAVATGDSVELVDVSDPMTPFSLRSVAMEATLLEVRDGLAYVTSGRALRVLDLVTGDELQALFLQGPGEVTALAREGSTLFTYVSGSDVLTSIDISTEGAAVVLDELAVDVAGTDVGLVVGGGVAWLSGSGLRTVSTSDPANLVLIHGADNFFNARRFALNGSGLGVLAPDGGNFVQVYDTSDPNNTSDIVTEFGLAADALSAAISRGIGYVGTQGSLDVVNYSPFDSQRQPPTVSIATSAVDVDLGVGGFQLLEGAGIPVQVAVTDDVQVRLVELLVNGQVVATDVSFPFDFTTVAPALSTGVSALAIQVRAMDTGGNTTLSDTLNFELVQDTVAPVVVSTDPAGGVLRRDSIRIAFSEPIDPALIQSGGITLVHLGADGAPGGGDDTVVSDLVLDTRSDDRVLLVHAPAGLSLGEYRLTIAPSAIADRAGNPLASVFALDLDRQVSTGGVSFGQELFGSITQIGEPIEFTFQGNAGQRVFYDALIPRTPGGNDLEMRILGPSGQLIDRNLIGCDSDRGPLALPETGTYTLEIDFNADSTGSFGFRILDVSAAPLVGIGQSFGGDVTLESDVYRFNGAAGQMVLLDFLPGTTFAGGGFELYNPSNFLERFLVFDEDGDELRTLPDTGEYMLVFKQNLDINDPIVGASYVFQVVAGAIGNSVAFPFNGDFIADGDVDGADFLTWQRGLGAPAPRATRSDGDADNDQDVDGDDLEVWKANFGTTSSPDVAMAASTARELAFAAQPGQLRFGPISDTTPDLSSPRRVEVSPTSRWVSTRRPTWTESLEQAHNRPAPDAPVERARPLRRWRWQLQSIADSSPNHLPAIEHAFASLGEDPN